MAHRSDTLASRLLFQGTACRQGPWKPGDRGASNPLQNLFDVPFDVAAKVVDVGNQQELFEQPWPEPGGRRSRFALADRPVHSVDEGTNSSDDLLGWSVFQNPFDDGLERQPLVVKRHAHSRDERRAPPVAQEHRTEGTKQIVLLAGEITDIAWSRQPPVDP